ncbi:hypothetical protein [Amaricoccus sp. B4]|uniref:hypothetical protein n=1 Tax=Amaricoccus sp. B4 TaxID=3368557 RepID=UPI003722213C
MFPIPRRLIWLALAIICLALAVFPMRPISAPAERVARDAAVASLGVYVALRSVNSALSFAQEIEVGGSFGISASAQPLKFLEPIDDTVERVADAIFWVALFAGVLAIGVGPLSGLGFLLLAVGLAIHAARGPIERHCDVIAQPICRAGTASNLTGALLAVLLPLSLALGGLFGEHVTRSARAAAMAQLAVVSDKAQSLLGVPDEALETGEAVAPEPDSSFGWIQDSLRSGGSDTSDALAQFRAYFGAAGFFVSHADELLESSLKLIAIFLLRTLVLPLALVVAMVALLRQVARPQAIQSDGRAVAENG